MVCPGPDGSQVSQPGAWLQVCVGRGEGRAREPRVRSRGAGSRHAAASSTAERAVCLSTPATRDSPGERRTSGLARRCLGNGSGVQLDFPSSVRILTPISWSCLQPLPDRKSGRDRALCWRRMHGRPSPVCLPVWATCSD